jgi:hypothetical protein
MWGGHFCPPSFAEGTLRLITPSPSYRIPLPDDISSDYDGKVASYWREGEPVLLQLSSTLRAEGPQISAKARLQDRIKRSPGKWSSFELGLAKFPGECTAAETFSEDGVKWIHIYITTPWLAIYATVSGLPSYLSHGSEDGALAAIRGIQLTPN